MHYDIKDHKKTMKVTPEKKFIKKHSNKIQSKKSKSSPIGETKLYFQCFSVFTLV